ncbi:cupin domain-containing protein [Cohnella fermenti]|uniref:Cupin domain-containing protein n=1 Tax=Cohnella fermenti TaxID=2565925 RepID=A0A4S4BTP2_9BACL|nr:cupin domain-containing protein [Cohnella fermenti]THF76234.1 cupin domain-containing protein [Cohnella fermenti]
MSMNARTVKHRYTGEQITFVETAAETGGKHLLIEVELPPNGDGPPLHYHRKFTEEFEVLRGRLTVSLGGEERVLEPGQTLTAPIGTAHTFRNAHGEEVAFRVKLTPPSGFEQSVRIHYGLMDDGLTDGKGTPKNPLHTALVLSLQDTLVAGIPLWLQRALFGGLNGIGRLTGVHRKLLKYTDER